MTQTQVKQYDFTLEEVQKLFQMQDELNTYIHPEWKKQGFNWGLAIVDECMEIHGHLGWKWWKKGYQAGLTEENRKQIQLEVIDILHFVVSRWVEVDDPCGAQKFADVVNGIELEYGDLSKQVSQLMRLTITGTGHPILLWTLLAQNVGLTKSQILETYTQKYVLNKFRQDHGYKDGSYAKIWHFDPDHEMFKGMPIVTYIAEDNFWLEDVVYWARQAGQDVTNQDKLYKDLEVMYYRRTNK